MTLDDSEEADRLGSDAVVSETAGSGEASPTDDQARIIPSDKPRPIIQPGPSSGPIPVIPSSLFEPGTGLELTPNHTGGNQTDLGPLTELAPPTYYGGAPIGDDTHSIELHHPDQDPSKPLIEMTRTEHRLGENYKENHPGYKSRSKIDRKKHNKIKKKIYQLDEDNQRFEYLKDEKHPDHPKNREEGRDRNRHREPHDREPPKDQEY